MTCECLVNVTAQLAPDGTVWINTGCKLVQYYPQDPILGFLLGIFFGLFIAFVVWVMVR